MHIQWNLSTIDTIGISLLIVMSFVEGSFNIIKYQNGTRKVSFIQGCPLDSTVYNYYRMILQLSSDCPIGYGFFLL